MSGRGKRGGRGSRGGRGGRGGRGPPVAGKIEVELPARMKTREANKDAHPGQADVPKSRRSAAEMELVRAVEAEQNAAEERQRLVLIQKVADMEDQLQHEDRNRSQEAYTGPPTVSKSTEAPKDPDVGAPDSAATQEASPTIDEDIVMAEASIESTEGEVRASQSDENSKSEHQGEGNIDEAEEGVKGKQKRKHATRDDVRAQRKTTDEAPVRVVVEDKLQKRKAAGGTDSVKPAKKAKKASSKPGGLDTKAVNATKATAFSKTQKLDDESMVRTGGFAEDEEDVSNERDAAISHPEGVRETVKINIPETTVLVKQEPAPARTTKKEERGGKPKWTLSHLPSAYQADFGRYVVPLIRAKQGTRPPWAPLRSDDLQEVLDAVAPGQEVILGGAWYDLSQYRCQDSRTNLGKYAIQQVHALFKAAPFNGDADKIKEYVADVTVMVGTGKNATSPFLWRHWGKTGKHKKGLLQTDLIVATFSLHLFETVRTLPANAFMPMCSSRPIGALIHAGQAVEHALKSYKTGVFVDPSKTPSTHFSATNYGDYYEISSGSKKPKFIKRATRYVTRLEEWPEETWADILARARAYVCEDQGAESTSAATAASEDEEDDGDFDLKSASGESDSDSDDDMGVELGE